jgi:hypothetical protein
MIPCNVCLGLDRCANRDGRLWEIDVRDDLTFEYCLTFVSSQLELSAQAGCPTCSIIWNGLELMNRKLCLFNSSLPCPGRLILQPGSPLEVELFNENEVQTKQPVRIQYYTIGGSEFPSVFS